MAQPTQDAPPTRAAESEQTARAHLREMWPYLREHRTSLIWVAITSLFATAFAVVQPLMLQQLVDSVGAGEAVASLVWLLIAVTLAGALFSGIQTYLLQSTAERVVLGVRRSVVRSLLSLPVKVFDARRVGDLMSRVGADTTLLRSVVTSGVFEVISSTLMFVAAVVLMIIIDPLLFALTLGTVLIGVGAAFILGSRVRVASKDAQEAVGAMSSSVERALSGIRTIKAAVAEDREAELIDKDARSAYHAGVRLAVLSAIINPLMSICLQAAFLVVLAVGGIRVANGSMPLGDLMAFILYLFLLVLPIGSAVGAFVQIQAGLAALDRIQDVVRLDAENADESAPDSQGNGATELRLATALEGTSSDPVLEFADVFFSYPAATPPSSSDSEPRSAADPEVVLRGVSFAVPAGSRTALVGPSGSGKSTTLALIERFYEPTSGSILLGGMPLARLPRATLRQHVALIEQDAPVLSGTLADNLRLADPGATDVELVEALRAVDLADLLDRSRDGAGLDLDLGEHGTKLSGGQRQRLAWARTLLGSRPIVLMDEPTSSVDSRTEHRLQQTLNDVAHDRTLLVVAHRLSTVVDFDQIVVLEAGQVADVGTHKQLSAREGVYRDMAGRQGLIEGGRDSAPTVKAGAEISNSVAGAGFEPA
ncbi:MAG: ABC transporter ATP-binding protein [Ornithinimicrobium sp.]